LITHEIKPIRTEADYEAAIPAVERLWGARSGTPEEDRLDVLATLIDAYESEHHPIDPPDPIEAIKFRMEQQGLTRKGSGRHSWHPYAGRRSAQSPSRPVNQHDPPAPRQVGNFGRGADTPFPLR
jgi:hypothetical protein